MTPLKSFLRKYILPIVSASLLLAVVKIFFVEQYAVPASCMSIGSLMAGDRVLANLTAYDFLGWKKSPQHNALIAFHNPLGRTYPVEQRNICISRVAALPGDTVWLDMDTKYASIYQASSAALPFVLPKAGEKCAVAPHTAYLLWNALRLQENVATCLVNGTSLRRDGLPLDSVVFRHDCYWVDGYGMVTHDLLAGHVFCVSFSLDEAAPTFQRLRLDRLFLPLH